MTDHVKTKHRLKEIGSLDDFNAILDGSTLNQREKKFLRMYYVDKHDLCFIADSFGLTESAAGKMHRRLLKTIAKVI